MLNVHNVTSLRLHPSCEATPIAPAKWPLIRSKSMFIFTLSIRPFQRGWPLKWGPLYCIQHLQRALPC